MTNEEQRTKAEEPVVLRVTATVEEDAAGERFIAVRLSDDEMAVLAKRFAASSFRALSEVLYDDGVGSIDAAYLANLADDIEGGGE